MIALRAGSRVLPLEAPVVMGVINATPDSFSDGGRYQDPREALAVATQMVAEGARIIDVGGESTRPGSQPPSIDEEIRRVVPVVEAIRTLDVMISVDTSRAPVIEAVATAGAHLINDVRGLRQPDALAAVARYHLGACLMHMQGEPISMQVAPHYQEVVAEVRAWLLQQIRLCEDAGMDRTQLVVDPGFGFGKTRAHNEALMAKLECFTELGVPLLIGVSRKSWVGQLTGRPVEDRLAGSVALAAVAVLRGALIVRAHDVAATVDAVKVGYACQRSKGESR